MKNLTKLTLAIWVLVLAGCSGDPEKNIVGKWQETEKPDSKVEFYDDGTLVASNDSNPLTVKGKWVFLEDGRLKTEMSLMGMEIVDTFTVTFDGETMTTVDEEDDTTIFTRAEDP